MESTAQEHSMRVETLLERLPAAAQTCIQQLAAAVSTTFDVNGETKHCRFLTLVVPVDGFGVSQCHVDRFGRLIEHLVTSGMVAYAALSAPIALPLVNNRCALIWYPFSDFTREELNEQLGCECFVEEGDLYHGEWPAVALAGE